MKTQIKANQRMEAAYVEALGLMGDLKTVYQRAVVVTEHLINSVAKRIEWSARENERRRKESMAKGESAPAPLSTMAELESIGRIVSVLTDPKLDTFRTGDPDAGVREIVRVLEEARREFRINEQKPNETTEGAEEAPEDKKEMEDEQGVKTRQIPTPEGAEGTDAKTTGRRFSNRRVVVRQ